jgi:outer membrane receptor protein involved in Fe transport
MDKYEINIAPYDTAAYGHVSEVKQNKDNFTYSLGVSYLPFPWLKLRSSYATSFKMPEPNTQMSYRPGSTTYLANIGLKPESSKGWEIGSDIYWNEFTVSATYFSVDYKNKIESAILRTGVRQYQNLWGITEYRGLEFSTSWDIAQTFGWDMELKPYISLTRMFRYFNTEKKAKTGYVQDLTASYGVTFKEPSLDFSASFDVSYFGHQYPHYTSTTQTEFGGETVMNFRLSKGLMKWGDHGRIILKADVTNLNDNFYETQTGFPEEGRAFHVGLLYEYR